MENQFVSSENAPHRSILAFRAALPGPCSFSPLIVILSRALLPLVELPMNRRALVAPLLGLVSLAAGTWLSATKPFAHHDLLVSAAGCTLPVRVIDPRTPGSSGSIIVLHGISANRRIMQYLGESLAAAGLRAFLIDLPGHGDNKDPFSPSRAESCAAGLLEELTRTGWIFPRHTVLLGHSMGAAIAIRLAQQFPAVATVAISPAPMGSANPLPPGFILFDRPARAPANLLILRGALEPRSLYANDRSLLATAGGERLSPQDFALGLAAHFEILPTATHTSLIFDSRVARASLDWIRHVLPLQETTDPNPARRALGGLLGLIGLILLFPALTHVATSRFAKPSPLNAPSPRSPLLLLAAFALSAVVSVLLLRLWNPLRALHILTAEYLAASMLFSALVLFLLFRNDACALFSVPFSALLPATLLGLTTVLLFGLWVSWQLTDAWMSPARWLRFFPLLIVLVPYHAAEEALLAFLPRQSRALRLVFFLVFRAILWLAWMAALFFLHSGQILLFLLTPFFLLLFLLQRLAAETVLLSTASRAAAALYGAILSAWLLAASLPLT